MKYPAYPQYKDSGVAWLGEVPEHWEVRRLKYLASINDSALPESTDADFEFSYIDIGSVNLVDGITATESMAFENAPSRARRVVQAGDIIVSTVRTYLRAIASIPQSEETLIVSTGFAVIRPRRIESKFLNYAFKESSFVENVVSRSVGVSYPAVNASEIGDIKILAPSETEQIAIANFLDSETGRIDTLVAKKRKLMELLKEKRSALISRTVTRGLPADAAREFGLASHVHFKQTEIEWWESVPESWEIKSIKQLLKAKKGAIKTGPFGSQLQSAEMLEGDIKVYNQRSVIDRDFSAGENYISQEKFKELKAFEVYAGDLLVTTRGTIGKCAVLPRDAEQGILHPCLMRLQLDERICLARFVEILIQESGKILEQLRIESNATTIDVIYSETLKEVKVALPPLAEQTAIATYLDRETAKIDRLVAKVETAITRLREYRSTLITAAVTGKIDVRGTA
ncbi:restriction endonuclease subunit S [Methylomonas rapida]|uniref:Restriction endonuclease subunit S n=1 Tax=Methylomonas rapida TaxID=2963939 RepID=A0ABY7GHJ5_9GAMM|nr:restriction endonuclease subunit S [Methylomonas rapida]WAR44724.1 restriction endonuclease subunit S [Methylomonas rapida]